MSRLPKTPSERGDETVNDFSIINVIIMLFLLAMFVSSTVYVLANSLP